MSSFLLVRHIYEDFSALSLCAKMGYRPDPGAETVEVVSSLDGWKLPGFKLERYSFGEFACFLGQQEHFDEISFKVCFSVKTYLMLVLLIRAVRYQRFEMGNRS